MVIFPKSLIKTIKRDKVVYYSIKPFFYCMDIFETSFKIVIFMDNCFSLLKQEYSSVSGTLIRYTKFSTYHRAHPPRKTTNGKPLIRLMRSGPDIAAMDSHAAAARPRLPPRGGRWPLPDSRRRYEAGRARALWR
jgi:hypothetical protein